MSGEGMEDVLIPSGTYNTTQTVGTRFTPEAVGIVLCLNVKTASGTGGLQVVLDLVDHEGTATRVTPLPTAVITTGQFTYLFYPGASAGNFTQITNTPVPLRWRARVIHGDATNYSYTLSAQILA